MAQDLVVFAAASLKGPLDEIAVDFGDVVISYGGSGTLARQISQGAPADVVLLANVDWMDVLETAGDVADPIAFTGNRLVVVGPSDAPDMTLTPDGLADGLRGGRIAMGFTNSVPAGIYGKAAFESLKLWHTIAPSVVEVDNVRAALTLVARGEVPLGVVYQSDVLILPNLKTVALFPADSHPPIRYLGAVTTQSDHADAQAFVDALRGTSARDIFETAGFCTDTRWC